MVGPRSNTQQIEQLEQHFSAFRSENNHKMDQLDHQLSSFQAGLPEEIARAVSRVTEPLQLSLTRLVGRIDRSRETQEGMIAQIRADLTKFQEEVREKHPN